MTDNERTLVEWVQALKLKRAELGDDETVVEHSVSHADEIMRVATWGDRKAEAKVRLSTKGVLAYLEQEE